MSQNKLEKIEEFLGDDLPDSTFSTSEFSLFKVFTGIIGISCIKFRKLVNETCLKLIYKYL